MHRISDLGFDIAKGKIAPQQSIILNKTEEELPSVSDVANADDIELQKITKNAVRSMKNLTAHLCRESSEDFLMRELLGLDKQLRSIQGLLEVETAKKVELQQCIERENGKLMEIRDNPEYNNGIREDIRCRISELNDNLSARQESIDILKGKPKTRLRASKKQLLKCWTKMSH